MAIIVEDGTGLETADAYVSEAYADTYAAAYEPEGFATWADAATTTAQKEAAIRKATQYLDARYESLWRGVRVKPPTQALSWPRFNVYAFDTLLPYTALPVILQRTTAELAVRFLVAGDIYLDVAAGDVGVKAARDKLGPLESEIMYAGARATRARYPKIERMISPLLLTDGGGRVALS